jgi:hypothetical protein
MSTMFVNTLTLVLARCMLLTLGLLWATENTTCAWAECPDSIASSATGAIDDWERTRTTGLSALEKTDLVNEYCAAADALHAGSAVDLATIANASNPVIVEYLDRMRNSTAVPESVDALLRSRFGAQGFARPVIKKYGIVNITYIHQVDTLQIGTQVFDPDASVLVATGQAHIVGSEGSHQVCVGDIQVSLSTEASFSC